MLGNIISIFLNNEDLTFCNLNKNHIEMARNLGIVESLPHRKHLLHLYKSLRFGNMDKHILEHKLCQLIFELKDLVVPADKPSAHYAPHLHKLV